MIAGLDPEQRRALRNALRDRYPWVADTQWGPSAVEAGECDGCGAEARLAQVCGPGADQYLGRRCLAAQGPDAWCEGHAADAAAAGGWAEGLPAEADLVARLWWVATGEVSLDPDLVWTRMAELGRIP